MYPSGRLSPRVRLLGLACAAVTSLTGCSTAGSTAQQQPAVAGPVTASGHARAAAEVAALAAYRGMWAGYAAAAAAGNPDHEGLATHATGDALTHLTRAVAGFVSNGQTTRGAPVIRPRVVSVSPPDAPTSVEIVDCMDTTGWLVFTRAGVPVNETAGGARSVGASAIDTGSGRWKVESFGAREIGSC